MIIQPLCFIVRTEDTGGVSVLMHAIMHEDLTIVTEAFFFNKNDHNNNLKENIEYLEPLNDDLILFE